MGFRPPRGCRESTGVFTFFDELSNLFDKQTNFYVTVRNEWHTVCVFLIGDSHFMIDITTSE